MSFASDVVDLYTQNKTLCIIGGTTAYFAFLYGATRLVKNASKHYPEVTDKNELKNNNKLEI